MKRSEFLKRIIIATPIMGLGLRNLSVAAEEWGKSDKMPVLFVGHGNPMNAILDNEITKEWQRIGQGLQPKAILCVSAHWETRGTYVTMSPKPRTIHDFGGFPQEMYQLQYPAEGIPLMAKSVINNVKNRTVKEDYEWGLDHGTWSVLIKMFPNADVPVFQLSIDHYISPKEHYELAKELSFLRQKGVLIVGSGNIIHNLRLAQRASNEPYSWAIEFDEQVKRLIQEKNHALLMKSGNMSKEAKLAIPTPEHYIPMLYSLALQQDGEDITFFNESVEMGSLSMRSFIIS